MPKFKVEVVREIKEYWIVDADNKDEAIIFYVAQGEKIEEKHDVTQVNVIEN